MAEKKITQEKTGQQARKLAVLLELENIAVNGRQIIYDTLNSILADKDITLTPAIFSRFCLNSSANNYAPSLLSFAKKTRLSSDKLSAEITEGIKRAFTDKSLKLAPAAKKIFSRTAERNIFIGAWSALDRETAQSLANNLGVIKSGATLHSNLNESEKIFPSADTWLKLAKAIPVEPYMCVVLATTSISCKAALSAGMHCIVIADKFSEYQDFGGADHVSDKLDEDTINIIFDTLEKI